MAGIQIQPFFIPPSPSLSALLLSLFVSLPIFLSHLKEYWRLNPGHCTFAPSYTISLRLALFQHRSCQATRLLELGLHPDHPALSPGLLGSEDCVTHDHILQAKLQAFPKGLSGLCLLSFGENEGCAHSGI